MNACILSNLQAQQTRHENNAIDQMKKKKPKFSGIGFKLDSTFIGKINLQQIITHHWHTHVGGGVSHVMHFHGYKRMMMLVKQFK
jgi:hypothetical protein